MKNYTTSTRGLRIRPWLVLSMGVVELLIALMQAVLMRYQYLLNGEIKMSTAVLCGFSLGVGLFAFVMFVHMRKKNAWLFEFGQRVDAFLASEYETPERRDAEHALAEWKQREPKLGIFNF